jgi:hypothetical protein
MARFVLRDGQQLKTFAPAQYRGDGIAGEGIIKDLSLRGSYIMGNVPVSVGMALALQIFVPGDLELLLIDRATVNGSNGLSSGWTSTCSSRRWPSESQSLSPRWSRHPQAHSARDKRSCSISRFTVIMPAAPMARVL